MDNPHLGINDRSAISSATLNGSCGSGGGGDTDSVGLRRSHGGGSPYGHHHHLSTGGNVAGGSHIVTVIVHKDENGYGMKVSGDNPVYVQSVKEGGAASKAGLYPGDKIIKVNGEDVIKSMHTDVVALIRSSTHVTLTVQQRHSSVLHHYHHPGVGGAGTARPLSASLHHHTRITGPQPVDNEKLREFENERVHTFRLMLEKEQRYVEQLRSDLATCGASAATKVATDLANAERNVATLQTQLQNLLHAHSELSASSSLSNTLPKPITSTNNFQNSMPHSKSDNQITEKPPPLPERNRPVKSVDHGNLDIVKTAPIKNLDQKSIFSDESQNLNRLKNFTPPKKTFPKSRKEINSNSLSPRVCSPSKFIVENQLYHDLVDSHNNLREKRLRQTSPPIPMSPKCQNARPYTAGSPDGSVPPPLPPRVPVDNKCPPVITTTSSGCSEVDPDAVNSINKQMSYPLIATCAALVNHSCSTKSPHIVNKHHRTKSSPDPLTPHISPKDATKKLLASESMSDLSENVPVQTSSDSWEMVSPDAADRVTPPGTPPPPYPSPCMSRNPNTSGRSVSVSGGSSQRSSGEHSDGAFVEEGPPGFADNVAEMLPPVLATSSPIMAATSNVVQQPIISMEDELSDQEMEQIENHGPFKSLSRLLEHLGHLAVFMNYILSNCDPSSILFYLLTDLYKRDKTQAKDLKKWAYEIHSTFLVPGAPLRLNNVDENIAREIDDALANESDKEEILKKVFWKARSRAKEELTERLAEFRQKRSAGLGTMYGPNDAQLEESINDKLKEAKIAEDLLLKKLDGYIEDIERDPPDPRRFSIAAALATICSRMFNFRQHPVLDRCPTFVSKDKNFKIKFIGKSRKLNHRGHHFLAHQYYTVTYCNNCQLHIWGIGPQAYQCSNCNTNVHRHCVRSFEENCPGPVVKKDRGGDAISKFMGRIRSDSRITGDGSRRKASGNFLIAERDRRLQEEGGDEVNNGERVFPSAPVSRTGSDRRSDASETPDTPDQEQDSATDHSHDSVHGIQKPKSAQSSINRSESYKEQSQKKRQHRERRKISDPNLSKSHDVEPDAHGLSYHTNSGSSSSSSLSSTRSLDTPSTSLDTVPALGTISRGAGESDPETERISDPADWASAVSDELLARLAPCEKKRQEVFNELLQTERSHVRQLRVLERVFHRPLRENLLLPAEQLSLMFPNLERMLDLHATFSAAMKALRRDSPLVADVGPVLLSMFDGTSGEAFERAATEFCARQQIALDWLRERRRKDAKLHSFLTECEADKLCRRLQLKDLIPMGIQRLTKYPLLFENLAKYTAQCLNDSNSANQLMQDELEKVQRAVERSREIVKKVNAAVKEAEDFAKLQDIQKRLDKSSLERAEHPEFTAFKNIDLTKHKLIHEGPLSWRPAPNKKISLYVLLLEDMIMLLQKQDDKYSLKFHGNPSLSPIIRVCNAIVRPNAADQNSIYLINGACNVAQMYELVAQSPSESRMWFKHISEATDAYRKREGLLGRSAHPTPVDNQEQDVSSDDRNVDEEEAIEEEGAVATTDQSQDDNAQDGEESEETPETKGLLQGEDGAPAQGNNLGSQNSLNRFGQHSPLRLCTEQSPLIPPSEVHVSNCPVMKAEPVYTPLEQLRRKDELIRQTLLEKQMLVADILCVPHGDFEHIADIAGEQARSREADATELVLAAVTQVGRLSEALNEAINLTDESAIALTANSVQQKHARLPAVPAHTLQPIVDLLSTELSHLLKRVKERDEEREKLRRELHKSREQIHILNELRRLHPDLMSNPLPNELLGENGRTDPETIKEEPSDCEADLDETQENPKNSNN